MKRMLTVLAVFALVAGACTAGGGEEESPPPTLDPSASQEPVTIEMWTFLSEADGKALVDVLDTFQEQYPWITVDLVYDQYDRQIFNAIRGGNPPDVASLGGPDAIGQICSTGAWIDLNPYIERDGVDTSIFPGSVDTYTQFEGVRCAMPMLTDAYGLFYNQDLFAEAGLTEPPETVSQLSEYAKALTARNPDGTLEVAGYLPWLGFYGEWGSGSFAQMFGAQWFDEQGNSVVNTDPQWKAALEWQKELIDWYGVDNVVKFVSEHDDEWAPDMAFQAGDAAMIFDGEWRVDTIRDQVGDELNYDTAPMPVADTMAAEYGLGQTGGTIIGIPKGSPNTEAAWLLVQYLSTDTDALVHLSNNFLNIPTTTDSASSPELESPPQFKTFLDIFVNPNSSYGEITKSGTAHLSLMDDFIEKWQLGKVSDLQAGLDEVAAAIDAQQQLGA